MIECLNCEENNKCYECYILSRDEDRDFLNSMKTCLICEESKSELNKDKITCDECTQWIEVYKLEITNRKLA